MDVLARPYFSLQLIVEPIEDLVRKFHVQGPATVRPVITPLVFPTQPYRAGPDSDPMVLWSPACAPHLTAFMPCVMSGDYFVLSYACRTMSLGAMAVRSTCDGAEWPVNEFIAYAEGRQQRAVRTMKDPRWDFWADGVALPFEDEAKYETRLIRKRLARQDVITYAEGWGAPVRDAGFWTTAVDAYTFVKSAVVEE